jgi:hypothetical protein
MHKHLNIYSKIRVLIPKVTGVNGLSILLLTEGTVFQWNKGKFVPKDDKKEILIGLRKFGRGLNRTFRR